MVTSNTLLRTALIVGIVSACACSSSRQLLHQEPNPESLATNGYTPEKRKLANAIPPVSPAIAGPAKVAGVVVGAALKTAALIPKAIHAEKNFEENIAHQVEQQIGDDIHNKIHGHGKRKLASAIPPASPAIAVPPAVAVPAAIAGTAAGVALEGVAMIPRAIHAEENLEKHVINRVINGAPKVAHEVGKEIRHDIHDKIHGLGSQVGHKLGHGVGNGHVLHNLGHGIGHGHFGHRLG